MTAFTGTVVYIILWWLALLGVLPFFARPVAAPDPTSGVRGITPKLRLGRALLVTTAVAAAMWFGADLLVRSPFISFRSGWLAMPLEAAD